MMKSLAAAAPLPCLLLAAVLSQESLAKQPVARLRAATTSRRCQQTTAFVTSLPRSFLSSPPITRDDVKLNASKKKSKPKKSNTSNNKTGGGFGTSSPTATKPKKSSVNNSAAFPKLEPQVRQTLRPSPNLNFINNEHSGTVLAEEMYDRLEDIYGLEKFNFGGVGAIYKSIGVVGDEEEKEVEVVEGGGGGSSSSSLFDDILSGGGSSAATASLSGGSSDPLEQLFGPAPAPSSESNTEATTAAFDLNILPPFEKFRVLHTDPMVLSIDDFFTNEECDKYVQMSIDAEKQQTGAEGETTNEEGSDTLLQPLLLGQSQTVGKDSRSKAQRTSTTWFHHYQGVPELMAKASRLLGLEGIDRFEEPQTVRYRRNEKFTWHLDALSPEEVNNPSGSGQRIATLLVYLTDVASGSGGATMFRDLGNQDDGEPLKVRPKKGSALLFFPSAGGIPGCPFDFRTLHCGEAVAEDAENEKWIAQLWLRQRRYEPTAPVGNSHKHAFAEIKMYCESTQD